MESYIVRVYRRNKENMEEIAGLVETVATDDKKAFQSFTGLVTAIRSAIGRGCEHIPSLSKRMLSNPEEDDEQKKQAGKQHTG